jgi:hypothetical protein
MCAKHLEIWQPQSPGTLRACPGLYGDCFTFTCHYLFSTVTSTMLIKIHHVIHAYSFFNLFLITYLFYLPTASVSQTMKCQMAGQHANNEFKMMSK